MKETLEIQCQIYILMKKVIILRKITATKKTLAPFFNHFSLSLNREKTCSYEKEGKYFQALAADLTNIGTVDLD